jgi:hypothetical protein
MKWLIKLCTCCFYKSNTQPSLTNFEGAGCLFTDGKHVLAGYQPNKPNAKAKISGFGGARLPGETYLQTAIREMLEELFGIIPKAYDITFVEQSISPKRVYLSGSYVVIQLSFADLDFIICGLRNNYSSSALYRGWPETMNDLVFKRIHKTGSEVTQLCILPLENGLEIAKEFVDDLNKFKDV